jgi:hypothetical protein
MLYLEFTDGEGVKRWELQAQNWPAVEPMLQAYGVSEGDIRAVRNQVCEPPPEGESRWIGHELECPGDGCIAIEGEEGPMGDSPPQRRLGDPFNVRGLKRALNGNQQAADYIKRNWGL